MYDTEGEYSVAALDQYEKTDVFFERLILVITPNKMMNLKMSITHLL